VYSVLVSYGEGGVKGGPCVKGGLCEGGVRTRCCACIY
jgi:hypothetical protein